MHIGDGPIKFLQHTCKYYSAYKLVGEDRQRKPSIQVCQGRWAILSRSQATTKGWCGFASCTQTWICRIRARNSRTRPAIVNPRYFFGKSHCPTVRGAFETRKNGLYFKRQPQGTRWKWQESCQWLGRPWQRCQCYHSKEGIRGRGLQGVRRPYIHHWPR